MIKQNCFWYCCMVPAAHISMFGMMPCLQRGADTCLDAIAQMLSQYGRWQMDVIIDGDGYIQEERQRRGLWVKTRCEPKADANHFACSAASIIAKTTRDNCVRAAHQADATLAVYAVDVNKGYGTEGHAQAIAKHGLHAHHRRGFCSTLVASYRRKWDRSRQADLFTLQIGDGHAQ